MNIVIITMLLIYFVESKNLKAEIVKKFLIGLSIVFSVWTVSQNIIQNPKPFSTEMLIAGIAGVVILALCLYVPSFLLFKYGMEKKREEENKEMR